MLISSNSAKSLVKRRLCKTRQLSYNGPVVLLTVVSWHTLEQMSLTKTPGRESFNLGFYDNNKRS